MSKKNFIFLVLIFLIVFGFLIFNLRKSRAASYQWTILPVDLTGDVGRYTSIDAFDANTIFISYYDVTNGNLRFAKSINGGTDWTPTNVDTGGDVGQYTSIDAFDANTIFISYYDVTNGNLRFAKSINGGTSWSAPTTADSTGTVGLYTSIDAIDANTIFISYLKSPPGNLLFAKSIDGGSSWTTSNVDTGGNVGRYTSIDAVDANTIFISYYDLTNSSLKFAKSIDSGTSWTLTTIDDSILRVGEHTSIDAIDANTIFISYYDDSNEGLKFAKSIDGGSSWTTRMIEFLGVWVGQYSSISAVDANTIFISYYSLINSDLKFAWSIDNGLNWTTSIVDSGGAVGRYTSIDAIDANTISISYYDSSNEGLKFAKSTAPISNVSLWAWSENIGWISFNSTDCDPNGDGNPSDGPAECIEPGRDYVTNPIPSYGVNINEITGDFSGFAWSEHIGWIMFDPPGPYPFCPATTCPDGSPNYPARLDFATRKVTGWARACAGTVNGDCNSATRTDGWDGWILLGPIVKGGTDYGVWIDFDVSPAQFRNWAWGEEVVGWISFNDSNTGGPIDYQVITTLSLPNESPSAINLSVTQGNYCFSPQPPIYLSWEYSDPDDVPPGTDPQSAYQVQVDDNSDFSSPEIDSGKVSSSSNSYAPIGLSYNTTSYWRVMVWDSNDTPSDDWIVYQDDVPPPESFTTPLHAYPWPDFTHSPQNPAAGEVVQFTDTSTCWDATQSSYSCKNNVNNPYQWDFEDDGTIDCDSNIDPNCRGDVTHIYDVAGNYTVKLSVTDDIGTCTGAGDTPVGVTLPLPKWREIPPH